MAKGNTLGKAQREYLSRTRKLAENKDSAFRRGSEHLKEAGRTLLSQTRREESKSYDDLFITRLEEGFQAIDHIILNPRTFIRENNVLKDAGQAKKINARTISHLASHTQFVHKIDKKGRVTPMRILAPESEVEFAIYENRFVMTLIKKAALFIEKRYNFIKDHGETHDSELFQVHNVTVIDGVTYEVDTRVKATVPAAEHGRAKHNADLLHRLAILRERAAFYLICQFAENLKGVKGVSNPIHQTNMIVKEPHYHAAYKLWEFLDAYTSLGVQYDVNEYAQEYDEVKTKDVYNLIQASILTMQSQLIDKTKLPDDHIKSRRIEPKVVFSLENETYEDGRFLYDQIEDVKKQKKKQEKDGYYPFPTPEEAKADREAIEEQYKELIVKRHLVDMAIEEDKARKIALEAEERRKALEEQMRLEEEARQEEEARRLAEQEAMDAEQRALWEKQQQEEEARLEALRMEMRRQALIEQGYDPDNLLNTPFAELPPEEETPAENPLDFLPSHEEERPVEEASAPEEKKEKVEKRAKGTLKKKNKRKGIVVPGSGDDGTTPLPKGKNAPRKIEKARPKKSRQVVRKVYKDHEGNTYSEAEVQARRHKGEAE